MHVYDVIVVGAGPSGLMAAARLSGCGLEVLLIDKNSNDRAQERLAVVSGRTMELLRGWTCGVVNTSIEDIILAYMENKVHFKFNGAGLYVLNVNRLHYNLYNECMDRGVDIRTNEQVLDIKIEDYYVEISTINDIYRSRLLIGADGANSIIGKKTGITGEQGYSARIEAMYKIDGYNDKNVQIDLSTIPYGYSMAFGCENTLLLQAASLNVCKVDIKRYFREYIASIGLKDCEPTYLRGGLIVQSNGKRQNYTNKRVMLIGDAARIANPLTGMGLYYAIKSSLICSKVILDEIKNGDAARLTIYNDVLNSELSGETNELHRVSRWLYSNKELSFKLMRHVPYAGKYLIALICGKLSVGQRDIFLSMMPWNSKGIVKGIRIIK